MKGAKKFAVASLGIGVLVFHGRLRRAKQPRSGPINPSDPVTGGGSRRIGQRGGPNGVTGTGSINGPNGPATPEAEGPAQRDAGRYSRLRHHNSQYRRGKHQWRQQ